MLDDAFADLEGQIQSPKRGVVVFEIFHNAQRMQVVIERKPVLAHGRVERLFSRVSKGRMSEVVRQGQRLYQIGVQSKLRGDGARNLRDFDGMGQPVAKVVRIAARENLSLRFQPPKCARVD